MAQMTRIAVTTRRPVSSDARTPPSLCARGRENEPRRTANADWSLFMGSDFALCTRMGDRIAENVMAPADMALPPRPFHRRLGSSCSRANRVQGLASTPESDRNHPCGGPSPPIPGCRQKIFPARPRVAAIVAYLSATLTICTRRFVPLNGCSASLSLVLP